ncbi:MAG: GNAT family N-acetyltransferase [Actinobacteria bacterium]|nr:GNAT family N-acetyltransferase [Actinomycetota bacterium]
MLIRNVTVEDIPALYNVCLKTGDSGNDATHLYRNISVLGEVYVGPYVLFNSDSSFVLIDDEEKISGYALSTFDTIEFEARCAEEWWPPLQSKYQLPNIDNRDQWNSDNYIEYEIFNPTPSPKEVLEDYPSHGHIDLMPHVQGKGWGKKLMKSVGDSLIQKGSRGMHLRVSHINNRALGFYNKLGYPEIMKRGNEVIVGAKYI